MRKIIFVALCFALCSCEKNLDKSSDDQNSGWYAQWSGLNYEYNGTSVQLNDKEVVCSSGNLIGVYPVTYTIRGSDGINEITFEIVTDTALGTKTFTLGSASGNVWITSWAAPIGISYDSAFLITISSISNNHISGYFGGQLEGYGGGTEMDGYFENVPITR